MRYIGNKENLVEKIAQILRNANVSGSVFWDFFAGTTSVSKYFKRNGWQIVCSDFLYLSYCLQKAYIENNEEPLFNNLLPTLSVSTKRTSLFEERPYCQTLDYLNALPGEEGFIFQNYTPDGTKELSTPRMYFSSDNGKKIDAIRNTIEIWKNANLISELEYYILIATMLESVSLYANVSGIYAAFQKKWDPRALKTFELRPIELIYGTKLNKAYCADSLKLCSYDANVDVLYLDPPYNQRQYAPNYHLLETIARWDRPEVRGVTGIRDYSQQKSSFCNSQKALESLEYVIQNVRCKYFVLSYNTEGLMPRDSILDLLGRYGKVQLFEFEYARYKSNLRIANAPNTVLEQVYLLQAP